MGLGVAAASGFQGGKGGRGIWGVLAVVAQPAEASSLQPWYLLGVHRVVFWRDFWLLSLPLFLSVF